jgi:hypothetical protein
MSFNVVSWATSCHFMSFYVISCYFRSFHVSFDFSNQLSIKSVGQICLPKPKAKMAAGYKIN